MKSCVTHLYYNTEIVNSKGQPRRMSFSNSLNQPSSFKTNTVRSERNSISISRLCHSCKQVHEDLNEQILAFKDKAHQSFMQVIQIQQLHEQELQLLKEQFNEKEKEFQLTQQLLQTQNKLLRKELGELERNSKRHSLNFDLPDLTIDNIDSIICPYEEYSSLDQSDCQQFRDILDARNFNEGIANLKRQLTKELKGKSGKAQIENILRILGQLKQENAGLTEENQKLRKSLDEGEKKLRNMKNIYQSLIKQSKFMTEHLKRVSNDKLKLQKKINELQRITKAEQENNNVTKSYHIKKRSSSPLRTELKDQYNLTSLRSQTALEVDKQFQKRGSKGYQKSKAIEQMECFKKKKETSPVDILDK